MTPTGLPFLNSHEKQLLIDGTWRDAQLGGRFAAINPANGKCLAMLADASAADVDAAVAASRRAFDGDWRKFRPADRQSVLLRIADLIEQNYDELAWLDTLDVGTPIRRTSANRDARVRLVRYYAGMATALHGETIENSVGPDYFSCTLRQPIGVVGAIIAWNAPLGTALWKLGPALATGCTLVLKPSEEAALSVVRLGELVQEAGLPPGVFNILTGGGMVGEALASHPGVDKISFTGSQATGRKVLIASSGNFKRVSLELGGKSPNIVFDDADLDVAVPAAAMAAFANAGQICSAGTRLFVQRGIYDEFSKGVASYAASMQQGDGADPCTDIGPLVSARQLERVSGFLQTGVDEGARLLSGGQRADAGALAGGFFMQPTVFADVSDQMRIASEEIFGPVLSVLPFDGESEVLRRANGLDFGLGAGVWTKDLGRAHRMGRDLQSGNVWVNCYNLMDSGLPFGGVKASGYGHEGGLQQFDDYTSIKSLWIKVG